MFVIKSSLGRFLRADAEAFTAEVREARRYATEDGARAAIHNYWGTIGPRYMFPVFVKTQRQEG